MCPSAALGFWCPGCGGLRAVNDLTNGQVGAALSSNLLVTTLIPFAVAGLAFWWTNAWRGRTLQVSWERQRPWVVALLSAMLVFAVVRNTGAGSWLAP